MAEDTIITVRGNLTADPELRYTQGGKPVANFTVASTPRKFDRASNEWVDQDALFMRTTVWGDEAENVAKTCSKGTRVVVTGRLEQNNYETDAGEKRSGVELIAEEVAVSLRYATAAITKTKQKEKSEDGETPF